MDGQMSKLQYLYLEMLRINTLQEESQIYGTWQWVQDCKNHLNSRLKDKTVDNLWSATDIELS